MNLNPEERDNVRLMLAAVAMHGLLGTLSRAPTGEMRFDVANMAFSAVAQADALLAALEKKS